MNNFFGEFYAILRQMTKMLQRKKHRLWLGWFWSFVTVSH